MDPFSKAMFAYALFSPLTQRSSRRLSVPHIQVVSPKLVRHTSTTVRHQSPIRQASSRRRRSLAPGHHLPTREENVVTDELSPQRRSQSHKWSPQEVQRRSVRRRRSAQPMVSSGKMVSESIRPASIEVDFRRADDAPGPSGFLGVRRESQQQLLELPTSTGALDCDDLAASRRASSSSDQVEPGPLEIEVHTVHPGASKRSSAASTGGAFEPLPQIDEEQQREGAQNVVNDGSPSHDSSPVLIDTSKYPATKYSIISGKVIVSDSPKSQTDSPENESAPVDSLPFRQRLSVIYGNKNLRHTPIKERLRLQYADRNIRRDVEQSDDDQAPSRQSPSGRRYFTPSATSVRSSSEMQSGRRVSLQSAGSAAGVPYGDDSGNAIADMMSNMMGFGAKHRAAPPLYQCCTTVFTDSDDEDSFIALPAILVSMAYAQRSGTLSFNVVRGKNFPPNIDFCQLKLTFLYDGLHGSQRNSEALTTVSDGQFVFNKAYQFTLPEKFYQVASVGMRVMVQERLPPSGKGKYRLVAPSATVVRFTVSDVACATIMLNTAHTLFKE